MAGIAPAYKGFAVPCLTTWRHGRANTVTHPGLLRKLVEALAVFLPLVDNKLYAGEAAFNPLLKKVAQLGAVAVGKVERMLLCAVGEHGDINSSALVVVT